MSDPHEVLGLPATAGEAEIRSRYLDLVREFPPDRAPERFAVIRAAYDQIRDPLAIFQRQLFTLGDQEALATIEEELRTRLRRARLPLEALFALAESPR